MPTLTPTQLGARTATQASFAVLIVEILTERGVHLSDNEKYLAIVVLTYIITHAQNYIENRAGWKLFEGPIPPKDPA